MPEIYSPSSETEVANFIKDCNLIMHNKPFVKKFLDKEFNLIKKLKKLTQSEIDSS